MKREKEEGKIWGLREGRRMGKGELTGVVRMDIGQGSIERGRRKVNWGERIRIG